MGIRFHRRQARRGRPKINKPTEERRRQEEQDGFNKPFKGESSIGNSTHSKNSWGGQSTERAISPNQKLTPVTSETKARKKFNLEEALMKTNPNQKQRKKTAEPEKQTATQKKCLKSSRDRKWRMQRRYIKIANKM